MERSEDYRLRSAFSRLKNTLKCTQYNVIGACIVEPDVYVLQESFYSARYDLAVASTERKNAFVDYRGAV